MLYDHPERVDSPRDAHTTSSPAAAPLEINDPRDAVRLLAGCAWARTAGARREGAHWMRKTIAVPLAAKCARAEVPQLEVTALAPLRFSAA